MDREGCYERDYEREVSDSRPTSYRGNGGSERGGLRTDFVKYGTQRLGCKLKNKKVQACKGRECKQVDDAGNVSSFLFFFAGAYFHTNCSCPNPDEKHVFSSASISCLYGRLAKPQAKGEK